MRIGTNPRAFQKPLSPAEAAAHIRSWLAQPCVQILAPGPSHLKQVLKLLESIGTAANLVTDAQLAALAIEHAAVLHTAHTGFLRFAGLRWYNPPTGTGSDSLRARRQK